VFIAALGAGNVFLDISETEKKSYGIQTQIIRNLSEIVDIKNDETNKFFLWARRKWSV